MKSLVKIYKHNIYGIIGTLVFHILVVGFLMITEAGLSPVLIKEKGVEIEIPVEYLAEEMREVLTSSETEGSESNEPSAGDAEPPVMTNTPSARGLPDNHSSFFDDSYEKEVEAARKLASDVDDQLAKEIVDINSISMPEDVTEGMKEEDIKNVVYSGESNIVYYLDKRHHLRLPIPVYLARGGGIVIVDIVVNREGKVTSAKARGDASIRDEQLFLYSQVAARRTVFNADPSAPVSQSGTIRYTFIPQ